MFRRKLQPLALSTSLDFLKLGIQAHVYAQQDKRNWVSIGFNERTTYPTFLNLLLNGSGALSGNGNGNGNGGDGGDRRSWTQLRREDPTTFTCNSSQSLLGSNEPKCFHSS